MHTVENENIRRSLDDLSASASRLQSLDAEARHVDAELVRVAYSGDGILLTISLDSRWRSNVTPTQLACAINGALVTPHLIDPHTPQDVSLDDFPRSLAAAVDNMMDFAENINAQVESLMRTAKDDPDSLYETQNIAVRARSGIISSVSCRPDWLDSSPDSVITSHLVSAVNNALQDTEVTDPEDSFGAFNAPAMNFASANELMTATAKEFEKIRSKKHD